MRRREAALGWALATVAAGVLWRMAPLHLPAFWWKYGGSALYAAMMYWLGVAVWPRVRCLGVGCGAFAVCCGVELFKLVRSPALDAFRLTLAGKLVLGRVFGLGAMVAYAVGILAVAGLDAWAPHRTNTPPPRT